MIVVYRAVKKWDDMGAAEMLHALRNQHYYDPKDDGGLTDSAMQGPLNRGLHRGEVEIYGEDYRTIRPEKEMQYLEKCKEEGITSEELPKWAGDH